jgi:hypothetical protein
MFEKLNEKYIWAEGVNCANKSTLFYLTTLVTSRKPTNPKILPYRRGIYNKVIRFEKKE